MKTKSTIVFAATGVLILSASSCKNTIPSMRMPSGAEAPEYLPYGLIKIPPYTLPKFRASEIDVAWLDSDDFLPLGAQRIHSPFEKKVQTYDTPKASFPSTDVCSAPKGAGKLACRSTELGRSVLHELILTTDSVPSGKRLLATKHAFEVLWSTDSRRVAVTHFGGRNSSEVIIYDAAMPGKTSPFNPRPQLAPYFSEYELTSRVFMKAFRWSDGPLLVVRAIGHCDLPPYEVFGYEILVDTDRGQDTDGVIFLRGFRQPNQRSVAEGPNKAPEPTPTAVTPRAIEMKLKRSNWIVESNEARGAPAAGVAHL